MKKMVPINDTFFFLVYFVENVVCSRTLSHLYLTVILQARRAGYELIYI